MAKNKVTPVEEIAEVGKESAEVGQELSNDSVGGEEPLPQGDKVQPNASKGEDQQGVSHPSTGSAWPKKTDSRSGTGPDENDEFFHTMISYRVATQGDAGDAFSVHLYKEMRTLSMTEQYKLPENLCGEWPSSAQPPEGYVKGQKIFKVYLDKFCLKGGERWDIGDDGEGGFMGGVLKSLVFVPLLSWEKKTGSEGQLFDAGSVGKLMDITEKTTFVDNVLLEWIVALKLHDKKIGKIRSIFPVFMGDGKDGYGRYTSFPFNETKGLPNFPAKVTNEKAADILRDQGIEDVEDVLQMTVKECVDRILTFQGVQLCQEGVQTKALTATAIAIMEVAKKHAVLEQISSTLEQFDEGRPQGLEVLEWLDEVQFSHLRFTLAEQGLDSLSLVSKLRYGDVEKLFARHVELFGGPPASMGDLTSFYGALSELKSDVRAQSLKQRLELFREDRDNEDMMSVFFPKTYGALEMSLFSTAKRYHLLLLAGAMLAICIVSLLCPGGILPVDIVASVMFGLFALFLLEEAMFMHTRSRQTVTLTHFLLAPCYNMLYVVGELIVLFACGMEEDYLSEEYGWFRRGRSPWFCLNSLIVIFATYVIPQYHYFSYFYVANFLGILFMVVLLRLDHFSEVLFYAAISAVAPQIGVLVLIHVKRGQAWSKITSTMKKDMEEYKKVWDRILSNERGHLEELARYSENVKKALKEERARLSPKWKVFDPVYWTGGILLPKGPLTRQGTIRQSTRDLDQLFGLAKEVHYDLQKEIAKWCVGDSEEEGHSEGSSTKGPQSSVGSLPRKNSGVDENGINDCGTEKEDKHAAIGNVGDQAMERVPDAGKRRTFGYHVPGPVKHPKRAIEKLVRAYDRDCAALCDLVRCTVSFDSVKDLLRFVKEILRRSQVGDNDEHATLFYVEEEEEKPGNVERTLRLTDIKDRFNPEYDGEKSMGYRDLSIKFEVGWLKTEMGIEFQPVNKWSGKRKNKSGGKGAGEGGGQGGKEIEGNRKGGKGSGGKKKDGPRARRLICEMQLHLTEHFRIKTGEGHNHYCKYRDMLGN